MIVLVCGGRDYVDEVRVRSALTALEHKYLRKFRGLIHGAAKGADRLAKQWQDDRIALEYAQCADNRRIDAKGLLGWQRNPEMWCAGYPADWEKHGPAAGPIRNQYMLDNNPGIELVIAFPGGKGTADMVRRAKAKGIPVETID